MSIALWLADNPWAIGLYLIAACVMFAVGVWIFLKALS